MNNLENSEVTPLTSNNSCHQVSSSLQAPEIFPMNARPVCVTPRTGQSSLSLPLVNTCRPSLLGSISEIICNRASEVLGLPHSIMVISLSSLIWQDLADHWLRSDRVHLSRMLKRRLSKDIKRDQPLISRKRRRPDSLRLTKQLGNSCHCSPDYRRFLSRIMYTTTLVLRTSLSKCTNNFNTRFSSQELASPRGEISLRTNTRALSPRTPTLLRHPTSKNKAT